MFKGGALRLMFMAQDLFQGEKILAFDLETTGVSTNNDRIVQYALIGTLEDGTPVNVEQLVKPPVRIPYDASNIHGIYNEDVRDKPPLSEVADELAELIDGAILVGHNVRKFDYAMLKNEFLRMGRLAPQPKAIMDTLELVRRLRLPRPHNLGALCQRHGIRLEAAHTAAADAAATMLLFWRLSVEHAGSFRKSILNSSDGSSPETAKRCNRFGTRAGRSATRGQHGQGTRRRGGPRARLWSPSWPLLEGGAGQRSFLHRLASVPKGIDCTETQERIKAHLRS